MVLLGMRWSRVAFVSPRTLQILSCSFGTSSKVSPREEGFSADRHLLALKNFVTHAESFSPGSRSDTS